MAHKKQKGEKKMSNTENKVTKKDKIIKVIKSFKKKTVWIPSLVAFVLLVSVIIYIVSPKTPEIADTKYLLGVITEASELTTAKINFTGKAEYKDSGVAFINKSDFIMMYEADARVGIDVTKVKVTANDLAKTIYVEIPKAEVLEVHVKADSVEYFDEKFSLFNLDKKEDGNKAIALAEEEARKELQEMGIIPLADNQAETLIKGLIVNAIPDGYKIEVIK